MITYSNTIPAVFVRRINRFTAEVMIDGDTEIVHVKNTGRLGELLVQGARVTLQQIDDPKRKTAYDLISVYQSDLAWVNIDSLAPNALMRQELFKAGYDIVRPEFSYGNSRVDFYMERGGEKYLIEVKGCTLAANGQQGIGLFPDAPTERGLKHLRELASASQQGYHCSVAFVIQMNGIRRVLPNDETQPSFGQALREAARGGMQILCYSCRVESDNIEITGMTDDTERYLG